MHGASCVTGASQTTSHVVNQRERHDVGGVGRETGHRTLHASHASRHDPIRRGSPILIHLVSHLCKLLLEAILGRPGCHRSLTNNITCPQSTIEASRRWRESGNVSWHAPRMSCYPSKSCHFQAPPFWFCFQDIGTDSIRLHFQGASGITGSSQTISRVPN